ncbi:hypothetical protein [Nocardia puris]|uniref:hypothetical protein n=1 Tax=Nocardia puris TaxID=208602 RepID=UPI002E1A41C7
MKTESSAYDKSQHRTDLKARSDRTDIVASAAVAAAAAALLFLASVTTDSPLAVTWGCLLVSLIAFGVFFPAVVTIAQQRGRTAPGATSALLGSGQFLLGAAASPIVGLFGTHTPTPPHPWQPS